MLTFWIQASLLTAVLLGTFHRRPVRKAGGYQPVIGPDGKATASVDASSDTNVTGGKAPQSARRYIRQG